MKAQKNKIKPIALFALLMLIFSCEHPIGYGDAEAHIIPISKAESMKNEYARTVASLISNSRSTSQVPYDPTQFAYIDLNTLKSYVALLEHVSKSNQDSISGVRIYFGAYPASDRNYPGRETVFMVPTVKVKATSMSGRYNNLEHLPFAIKPSGSDKYVGSFEIISELLNGYDNNAATYSAAAGANQTANTSLILDDLQLTPPPR